jgi:sulfite exporter TauE/SafE
MTLLLAVLGASLLGSVHCAAMCGGFVCMYSGLSARRHDATAGARRSVAPHVAYNGGRLVSYLVLGAVAGALGSRVDQLGGLAHIGRLAAIVAGVLMAVWGSSRLLAALGVRVPQPAVPRVLQTTLGSALLRLRGRSAIVRGAATGLLTTLLPCGWLYVFVATAAGSGRVRDAMLVMLFFWLGTLPMMTAVGFGAQRLFGTFQRRLPLVSAGAAVVLGLLSVAGKIAVRPLDHAHQTRVVEAGR